MCMDIRRSCHGSESSESSPTKNSTSFFRETIDFHSNRASAQHRGRRRAEQPPVHQGSLRQLFKQARRRVLKWGAPLGVFGVLGGYALPHSANAAPLKIGTVPPSGEAVAEPVFWPDRNQKLATATREERMMANTFGGGCLRCKTPFLFLWDGLRPPPGRVWYSPWLFFNGSRRADSTPGILCTVHALPWSSASDRRLLYR